MAEMTITEQVLLRALDAFQDADPTNAAAAELLRDGLGKGKLQDAEWITDVLLNAADSLPSEGCSGEDPEA